MSKAGQAASAAANNVTIAGGGVLSNINRAVGGGLKGLGNILSGDKK